MSASGWQIGVDRYRSNRKKEKLYTNAQASRDGIFPCETDPRNGNLSRLDDPYHGAAEITVGQHAKSLRRVCMSCAERWHKDSQRKTGI